MRVCTLSSIVAGKRLTFVSICLASITDEANQAGTDELVYLVNACSTIEARVRGALVDINLAHVTNIASHAPTRVLRLACCVCALTFHAGRTVGTGTVLTLLNVRALSTLHPVVAVVRCLHTLVAGVALTHSSLASWTARSVLAVALVGLCFGARLIFRLAIIATPQSHIIGYTCTFILTDEIRARPTVHARVAGAVINIFVAVFATIACLVFRNIQELSQL